MLPAVDVLVVARFLVPIRVIPLVTILSAIPSRFKRIDASFFDVLKEVLYLLDGVLNNLLLAVMFIIPFGKSSRRRNSNSDGTFFLKAWY